MPRSFPRNVGSILLALLAGGALRNTVEAQKKPAAPKVKLSAVLAGFLVDSGVKTQALAWTTGGQLPIKWATPGPVANPDRVGRSKGMTLTRSGTFTGTVGDTVALAMSVQLTGAEAGLTRVSIGIESMAVRHQNGRGFGLTREMVEQALKHEGVALTPLKCSRDKEGASYGNLADAIKVAGKTASGLWWYWDSPQQRMRLTLTLLYRRADMNDVECVAG